MSPSRELFISHASEDADIAEILATTIRRTTLEQLRVWFSSDSQTSGGIRPGEIWTQTLFKRLRSCDLLLTVVTPNSLGHPWVYFEAGVAVSGEESKVVPVCVGIDPTKLSLPLGMFQAYMGSAPVGLADLVERLCEMCGAKFDREMAMPFVERAARQIAEKSFTLAAASPAPESVAARAIQDHVDKRFYELTELLRDRVSQKVAPSSQYTFTFRTRFPELRAEHVLVVSPSMTIQDALDQMFFFLNGQVQAYTYLQSWGLFRHPDMRPLITAAGGTDEAPASAFLSPNTTWEAWRLSEPFTFGRSPRRVPVE